jgi:hypothetical protein
MNLRCSAYYMSFDKAVLSAYLGNISPTASERFRATNNHLR